MKIDEVTSFRSNWLLMASEKMEINFIFNFFLLGWLLKKVSVFIHKNARICPVLYRNLFQNVYLDCKIQVLTELNFAQFFRQKYMISKSATLFIGAYFGVKFEINSLLVLELLTIKTQMETYFNEVLLVPDCSKSAKKTRNILNNITLRLFWNLESGIRNVNFFRYLDRIFWRHSLRGVLKFL